MCGRYQLEEHWLDYCDAAVFDWDDPPYPSKFPSNDPSDDPFTVARDETRPTDRMPIVRLNERDRVVAELRRWGYILLVDGKTIDPETSKPKKVRRDVINAMSEKLTSSYMWQRSFKERRCLIPMSSWDEWPETGAGKQRVRVSMPGEPVFMTAGLYDENVDPKTGAKVAVYTMCTVPPNAFLGTVHDRAPMVLQPHQYSAWLADAADALELVGTHPDATAFDKQVL